MALLGETTDAILWVWIWIVVGKILPRCFIRLFISPNSLPRISAKMARLFSTVTCMGTQGKETFSCMAVYRSKVTYSSIETTIWSNSYPICLARKTNSSNLTIASSQTRRKKSPQRDWSCLGSFQFLIATHLNQRFMLCIIKRTLEKSEMLRMSNRLEGKT